ncbi:hypothetical protein ACWD4G_10410 [Streptomyces sp. NPDC002643]
MRSTLRRALAVTAGLFLSVTTAQTASAVPTDPAAGTGKTAVGTGVPAAGPAAAAACPAPGSRVKTPTSARVHLVDPDDWLRHIPDSTVYFSLWDSWNGIVTISDSLLASCWPSADNIPLPLTNAHLAKTSSSSKVYIYDSSYGGYRWITSADTFNHYDFAWGKIRTQEIDPDSVLHSHPWD